MSNVAFEVNPYATLFEEIDKKIAREYMISRHPETAEQYKRLGQKGTDWDRILTRLINNNPKVFGDQRLVSPKGNMFRDLTSHAILSNKDSFHQRVESILRYQYDASEDEIRDVTGMFPNIQSLIETPEFKKLFDETKRYRNEVERGWDKSRREVEAYLKKVIGIDLSDEQRRVVTLVMPPITENQRNYPIDKDKVLFIWSHHEKIKRHPRELETASIAHAKLHHALPYKSTMTAVQKKNHHAFIKFATDKEWYLRATGESYLGNDSKGEDGDVMGLVYPYWLGYLHRKDENPIAAIRADIKRDKQVFDSLKKGTKKRKLYESYNFERLSPEKIATFFRYKKGITPYQFNDIDFSDITNVYEDRFLEKGTSYRKSDSAR